MSYIYENLSAGSMLFWTMSKREWTLAVSTMSQSGEKLGYLPATQTGFTEFNKSYEDENLQQIPKSLNLLYRRVPGLGTALTKTAMKDIEEQGVKVGIIFNTVLNFIGT